ncbi:MAG: histidine phosphatase family protein [Marinifilaceae bacterium]
MIEIYLVRHGETDYNKNHRLIGGRSSHIHINERGIQQSRQLGAWFRKNNLYFDAVYGSTSNRAQQTLKYIFNGSLPSDVILTAELEELSQGAWEGKERAEIYTDKQLEIINSNNYTFKAPGGESQQEVETRMYQVMEPIISQLQDGKILVVSHGTAIKCLLRKILNSDAAMTYKIGISNCGVTKILYSPNKGWEIEYINRLIQ